MGNGNDAKDFWDEDENNSYLFFLEASRFFVAKPIFTRSALKYFGCSTFMCL